MLSVLLLGVAPAPVSAATTISGAVVAIAISNQDWDSSPYRLEVGKATYLATFGGGNSDALINSSGGCAIKSGRVSCYGRAGTVGDGTIRSRPLAVPITIPGGTQVLKLVDARLGQGTISFDSTEGNYSFSEMGLMCAQATTAVFCWGKNGGQTLLSPVAVYNGATRLFTGTMIQDATGAIYHWEPSSFASTSSGYQFAKVAGSVDGFSADGIVGLQTIYGQSRSRFQNPYESKMVYGAIGTCVVAVSELRCLYAPTRGPLDARVVALYPPIEDPAPLSAPTNFDGVPIAGATDRFCTYLSRVVSCSRSEAYSSASISGTIDGRTADGTVWLNRPSQMTPLLTLPMGVSDPVITQDQWGRVLACAIHEVKGVVCVNEGMLTGGNVVAQDTTGGEQYPDIDGDGLFSIGREMALDCGVGFSCTFTATKLRASSGIITAVGTLVRTPRTSAQLSGVIRYPDGSPFSGQVSWLSSDRKLQSTAAVSADGAFSLPARSGMGSITFWESWGEQPAACADGTFESGCVTGASATIYVDSLAPSNSVNIVIPTYQGEMRTIDLRFGDGETPISNVRISGSSASECTTTVTTLGRMFACASFTTDHRSVLTGEDGTVSIWMPTNADVVLSLSAADEYGLTWTEEIVSAADDGPTPEPYSFAGLIYAQPMGVMSVRQGSTGLVGAMVSVDGIDPAYGLSAAIKPASAGSKTCTSERLIDASDESGLVDFSVCPAGTQLWRVYSTDGSFFPSAAFPVTVDPALAGLQVSGATLDTPFSGGTTEYSGRFTSSRVTFTATKASWARSATVTASSCSRPTRGTKVCTVKVKVGSATMIYTFTFRR